MNVWRDFSVKLSAEAEAEAGGGRRAEQKGLAWEFFYCRLPPPVSSILLIEILFTVVHISSSPLRLCDDSRSNTQHLQVPPSLQFTYPLPVKTSLSLANVTAIAA